MKDILLKIIGNQIVSGDGSADASAALEFITEGKFYRKGDSLYLVYEESEFSGMEGCTTSLKITGDTIKMKRYGEDVGVETAISFEKGKRINGYYETPFGSVEMEVLTNAINNRMKENGEGSIDIDYNVSLKGLAENRSMLSIEIL
ncbi:MAG: DUF1934 domain-containing protein [Clostridiales Family XIII bacterium]|jgi:uncharacterized beta-barrel protein YwiB (DUF1934 family)|nr:DUF1934 domain-containing protein [Clostridiales Family XIII bacterium]